MFSTVQFVVIVTILGITVGDCQKWSDYDRVVVQKNGKNNGGGGRTSAYIGEGDDDKVAEAKNEQSKTVVRGGIGGWGIIAITLTIIFAGVGIYQFIMFYPILCKKERMYDVMEMTAV